MTKLSDTQAIILSAAAQRADGNLLPLPGSLRGGAAIKVVGALLTRGFAQERATESMRKADPALNTIWRNDDEGRGVFLLITAAGLHAIGVEREGDQETTGGGQSSADGRAASRPTGDSTAAAEPATALGAAQGPTEAAEPRTGRSASLAGKTREGTKQAGLIAMLRREEGATIAQIVAAIGWQPHTVRGAFAGALRKKLGLTVTSEKVEGGERVYRIEA